MSFNAPKNYGPVTMDQIMISDDDDDVANLASELELADAVINARYQANARVTRCRIVLAVLGAFALLGIGIGIGMIYVQKQIGPAGGEGDGLKEWWKVPKWKGTRGKDKDDSSDDLQRTHISKPPDDLSDICSPTAVQSKQGFSKCKATCNVAACCNLPGDGLSCLEANEKACASYDAFCEVLNFDHNGNGKVEAQEHVTVPKPPSNLREVCEWDELTTIDGYKQCESACNKGKCCYEAIETCQVDNPELCEEYDACAILHVQEVLTVPKPSSNLERLCSADAIVETTGFKACKDACDPGECCREPIET
eukprot:14573956-Ditylum_brightwellii.AAC.1